MYYLLIFLFLLVILYAISYPHSYEHFKVWDYEYPLSDKIYTEICPITGSIEELDNPTMNSCYRGYYIPYLFNVGTYVSSVQPQI